MSGERISAVETPNRDKLKEKAEEDLKYHGPSEPRQHVFQKASNFL